MVELYAKLLLQTIYSYRRGGRFQLHEFVVMPEHAHLLFTPAKSVTLEHTVQLIKGGYSHEFGIQFGKQQALIKRAPARPTIHQDADLLRLVIIESDRSDIGAVGRQLQVVPATLFDLVQAPVIFNLAENHSALPVGDPGQV